MLLHEKRALRDKRAYEEAENYLLQLKGMSKPVLVQYFKPLCEEPHRLSLAEIYEYLLRSVGNGYGANAIGKCFGQKYGTEEERKTWNEKTRDKLKDFDVDVVAELYGTDPNNWRQVYSDFCLGIVKGEGIVAAYCKAIISGAKFISEFSSAEDFCNWLNRYADDDKQRYKPIKKISKEVDGIGFALACDFVKEIGYKQYLKPDRHIKDIFIGLALCFSDKEEEIAYAGIRAARNAHVDAYDYDKVFFLIGSGAFYRHKDQNIGQPNKAQFIEQTREKLEAEGLLV
jgi:hypothetical protein